VQVPAEVTNSIKSLQLFDKQFELFLDFQVALQFPALPHAGPDLGTPLARVWSEIAPVASSARVLYFSSLFPGAVVDASAERADPKSAVSLPNAVSLGSARPADVGALAARMFDHQFKRLFVSTTWCCR
jgi:hypothetical protein